MTEDFLQQLKKFKGIEPDKEYSQKSFRLIMAGRQEDLELNGWRTLLVRISTVGVMLVLALFAVSKSSIPMKVAGLDVRDLKAEAEELDINLNLAEIKEISLASNETDAALEESAKSGPGHLNTTILKREVEDLNTEQFYDKDIDSALEASAN